MQVVKFGGSSVADAGRMRLVASIVLAQQEHGPVVVVVSAMAGVTDALLRVAELALAGHSAWRAALEAVGARHRETYEALGQGIPPAFTLAWQACVAEAEQLAGGAYAVGEQALAQAHFSGWGERLVVGLLARALAGAGMSTEAFDGEPILLASLVGDGEPPEPSLLATRGWLVPQLSGLLLRGAVPVLPGYIARDARDRATVLGRNGSDFSAAIVAAALGARRLTIYSDVPGLFTADPRLVPEARLIPWLTYTEAAAIAGLGAKVLHPRTVEPLVRWGIPLELRSTLAPTAPGTTIVPQPLVQKRTDPYVIAATTTPSVSRVALHLLTGPDAIDFPALQDAVGLAPAQRQGNTLWWEIPSTEAINFQRRLHHLVGQFLRRPAEALAGAFE